MYSIIQLTEISLINDNPEFSPRGVGWIGVTGLGHPKGTAFYRCPKNPPNKSGEGSIE
ncbi:MAG: hypothetical protein ACP6IP_02840 [Candidatus Njordarchaeia archaeon]